MPSPTQLDVSKINIHEVAKQAGVSIASVSRALNNKPGVSHKTKQKILEICEDLGFATGGYARELVSQHRNNIAISMGPFYQASRYLGLIWPALSVAIRDTGKSLLPIGFGGGLGSGEDLSLGNDLGLGKDLEPGEESFSQIGGVILLSSVQNDPRVEALVLKKIPFVCLGYVDGQFWVASDDFNGGRIATQHLIDRGKTQIAFVTPNQANAEYQTRFQGYTSVMASKGLSIQDIRTGKDPISELAAYQTIMDMSTDTLDAIEGFVCEGDEIALGVKTALEKRGYLLPEQKCVVGYDGIPHISDKLTTVVQDYQSIAHHIADLLGKAIAGEKPTGIAVPVCLKQGEST